MTVHHLTRPARLEHGARMIGTVPDAHASTVRAMYRAARERGSGAPAARCSALAFAQAFDLVEWRRCSG